MVGEPQNRLVWLKNAGNLTIKGPWELHILRDQGEPDVEVQFDQGLISNISTDHLS